MDCQNPCPRYERAMSILGKKWTCLILRCLMGEARRFTDISVYVRGLSDRLLSQRLQELEETGIVERRVYAQQYPSLTISGSQLVVRVFLGPKSDLARCLAPEACGLNRVIWSRRNVYRYRSRCCRALGCWSFDGWSFSCYNSHGSPSLVELLCNAGFADNLLVSTYYCVAPD